MIAAALAWLAGTKAGRIAAAGAVIAVAIGVALFRAFGAGRAAERAKATQDRLKAVRDRRNTDAEVDALGPADVDRRLDRWMRND